MGYTINFELENYDYKNIKDTSDIKNDLILVLLDNKNDRKLFTYYYYIKQMIVNNNRVVLLIDRYTSNIEKQICMLMASYNRYDIYRLDDIKDLNLDYVASILDRNPTREEIEQFIGCDIAMYANVNEVLTELYSLVNKPEELEQFVNTNSELLDNAIGVIDYLKLSYDDTVVALNKVKEALNDELSKVTNEFNIANSKLKESSSTINSLSSQLDTLKNDVFNYKKELDKYVNLGSAPRILNYSTLNVNVTRHKTGAILYFKEIGKLRYINSFIYVLCSILKMKCKLSYKLLIYDNKIGLGTYKPLSSVDSRSYNERRSNYDDINKNLKLVITEPSTDILHNILNAGLDVVIVYDRFGINKDLVSGAIVYKYNVVGSSNEYRCLKSLDSSLSDDFIIGPPHVSKGIIGIPDFTPDVVERIRNSVSYGANHEDASPILVSTYGTLRNPCRNNEPIIGSILNRINADKLSGGR